MFLRDEPKSEMRQLVDRIDELFGGSRTDDAKTKSTLRLNGSERLSRFEHAETAMDIRFSMKLGIFTRWQDEFNSWLHRQKKDIEADLLDESSRDPSDPIKPSKYRPRPNILTPIKDPWRFTIEKHGTIARHPNFWAHARILKDFEFCRILGTFSTEAGWSLKHKWESSAGLSFSTSLAPRWAFAFGNGAGWQISEKSFSTSHGPSISYLPGKNQAMNLAATLATTVKNHVWFADSYTLAAAYRIAAWRDWVFAGGNAGISFAKTNHFQNDPGVGVHVEIVY